MKSGNRKKRVKRLGAMGLATILLMGLLAGCTPSRGVDLETYRAEGTVNALYLSPPEDAQDADEIKAYFEQAADFAQGQGCNTLVFEAKEGITVWWRDDIFPPAQGLAALDSSRVTYDPLSVLCEVLAGREIQLWVSMNPYSAEGLSSGMEGSAAELARKSSGTMAAFDPSDADYRKLLVESAAALPKYYPVAGVVLAGLADKGSDGDIAFTETLGEMKEKLAEEDARLAVETGGTEDGVDPAVAAAWVPEGKADYLIPTVDAGKDIIARLDKYCTEAGSLILDESFADYDPSGAVLFTASRMDSYGGAVLGRYPNEADPARIGFLQSTQTEAEGTLPEGFEIPTTLAVNYPLESDAIGAGQESVFVMGTSDSSRPLTLDGDEVERYTTDGAFGVLVPLKTGKNKLVFRQGDEKLVHVVTRGSSATGGGSGGGSAGSAGGGASVTEDNTKEADEGQAVQVTGVFTGALSDPNDDSAINETLYGGAVAVVQESTRIVRYDSDAGKNLNSWAYKLTSGDWVAAASVAWVDGKGKSAFTGLSAQSDDIGEWITFEGEGTPAATISCKDNILSVSMWDTTFKLAEEFSSELVKSAEVEKIDDGVRLDLEVSGIWGYTIDYADGNTRLFLKRAPRLSGDAQKPLAGTRVMLDPGHGDTDIGAPGVMGAVQGPNEKDANLAQAQAITYRLRQMGAEVILLRDGDTPNYTTHERLGMLIEEKPDFFIAVHHNSAYLTSDLNGVAGLQVYYHLPSSYTAPRSGQFAQLLMDSVSEAGGRKATDAAYGYFNVTRTPVCPAVLFEYGFMIDPAEFEDIMSADGLWSTACGTAEGIYNMVALQGAASDIPDESMIEE